MEEINQNWSEFPLSFPQEQIWLQLHTSASPLIYNYSNFLEFHGEVNISALEESVHLSKERQQMVRASFHEEDGRVFQRIRHNHIRSPIPILDLVRLSTKKAFSCCHKYMARNLSKPFNVSTCPLGGTYIILVRKDLVVLQCIGHHLIIDGAGAHILELEIRHLYKMLTSSTKKQIILPPVDFQYSDYVLSQRNQLPDPKMKDFWQEYLKNVQALNIPKDGPRVPSVGMDADNLSFVWPPELVKLVCEMAGNLKVTPFVVILSALSTLLGRNAGQTDVPINIVKHGRTNPKLRTILGHFASTLLIRSEVREESSFKDFVSQLGKDLLTVYANEEYPYHYVLKELGSKLSKEELFPVALIMTPDLNKNLNRKFSDYLEVDNGKVTSEITIYIQPKENSFVVSVKFNPRIQSPERIQELITNLKMLITNAIRDPSVALSDIEINPVDHYDRLRTFTIGRCVKLTGSSIVELFEESVKMYPFSTAIVEKDQETTYLALNKNANGLALQLRRVLEASDNFVAILLPQSENFIRTTLAILKLGKTVVPLSVKSPTKVLLGMLAQIGNPLLISTQEILDSHLSYSNIFVLGEMPISCEPFVPEICDCNEPCPPYCLFTSGSTGTPKAVILSHTSILNYCHWIRSEFKLSSKDRSFVFNNVTFDLSLGDIWPFLHSGAELHIPPDALRYGPIQSLWKWISEHKLTFVDMPTTVCSTVFNSNADLEDCSVRILLCGGERLPSLRSGLPFHLVDGYGLTECTIVSAFAIQNEANFPCVGAPIWNTEIHVVDSNLKLVPKGITGSILIAGAGAAKYWQNDLQHKFTKVLFSEHEFFQTGDLGFWRFDGNLCIVGRMDNQIKVRGYRVESGEIEQAIAQHPDICQAVVQRQNSKDIVAYCKLEDNTDYAPSLNSLQSFLRQRVPYYAIPSVVFVLKEFPLNSNGKIDKSILNDCNSYQLTNIFSPPSTSEEKQVARVWADILNLQMSTIGVNDNFFQLGGHSLHVANMCRSFGDLKSEDLFRNPTVGEFAKLVKSVSNNQDFGMVSSSVAENGIYPMSLQQEQIWFHMQKHLELSSLYIEAGSLSIEGAFDSHRFRQSIEIVFSRHNALRSNYFEENGKAYMKVNERQLISIQRLNLRKVSLHICKVISTVMINSSQALPFAEDKDTLITFRTIQFSSLFATVQIVFQHLVLDALALHFLEQELATFYKSRTPQAIEGVIFQYTDFVAWQRSKFSNEFVKDSCEFWRNRLANLEPLNIFPHLRQRRNVQNSGCGSMGFCLSKELTDKIKRFSALNKTTPFIVLMSALKVLLYHYTHQEDIFIVCTSSEVNNKNLIGYFINMIILRTILSPKTTFFELVNQVHKSHVEMLPHQRYPYQYVIRDSNLESADYGLHRLCATLEPRDPLSVSQRSKFFFEKYESDAKFELLLGFDETAQNFAIYSLYDKGIYDESTVVGLNQNFEVVLHSAFCCPRQEIGRTLMPRDTFFQSQTHSTEFDPLIHSSLHDIFLQEIEKYLDNSAIVDNDSNNNVISYGELLARTSNIQSDLMKYQHQFVAVLLPQSSQFVVCSIAILMANKICVPLDIDHPMLQLQYILEELGNPILLTTSAILDSSGLPYENATLLDKKNTCNEIQLEHSLEKSPLPPPAYCLFTSGSTGKPKGVLINHSGIVNCVRWMQTEFNISQSDKCLLFCSTSFDVSLAEIWPVLLKGGTLCIPPHDIRYNVQELHTWVQKTEITFISLTPKVVELFFQYESSSLSLRNLISAGEMLMTHPNSAITYRVTNCYGATECTIHSTVKHLENGITGIPSVGRGFTNSSIHVFGGFATPVPIGVVGEVYISGLGVTKGYVNRPLLNSSKFLNSQFGNMYRTGDLGYWLSNGELMIVGRTDNQVKILGQRIELGQIESGILRYPGTQIQQAVVLLENESKLVAYCVGKELPDLCDLTNYLRRTLHLPYIPPVVAFVPEISLTSNGKVNKSALKASRYKYSTQILSSKFLRPSTFGEIIVAEIWSDVLKIPIEHISIQDSFFMLGGSSLHLGHVAKRLQEPPNNFSVTVGDMFRFDTLEKFALCLTNCKS